MAPKHTVGMPVILPFPASPFRRDVRLLHNSKTNSKPELSLPKMKPVAASPAEKPVLAKLPTKNLLRAFVVTSFTRSRILMQPSLRILDFITKSKSAVLNPDRNPVLNHLLRWAIYNHFCAGTNRKEVSKTVAELRRMGYPGVILTYAGEVVLDLGDKEVSNVDSGDVKYGPESHQLVENWKRGQLETLQMLQEGDFVAVKLTGAGPLAVDALRDCKPIPTPVQIALDEICETAINKGCRIWFDAEQQILQHGVDEWAIEFMRKYNHDAQPVIYNTIQAYLKGARANLDRHITLATRDGWTLGIKLVRGAYIEHEVGSLIHDTKEETDKSYDELADMLLSQKPPKGLERFPLAGLFLATHNANSAEKALATHSRRCEAGLSTITLEFGQIQGMADELSCTLLTKYEESRIRETSNKGKVRVPKVLKCMTWGSVAECIGYLHRRAIENRGAVERTKHTAEVLKTEIWRRMLG